MTRATNFNEHTYRALSLFEGGIPTTPRGISMEELLRAAQRAESGRRRSLRPTWYAVAAAGIVGTLSGVLITVLSGPVVGG